MQKVLLFSLIIANLITTAAHANTLLCPAIAKCKSNHFYSCSVDSDSFEVSDFNKTVQPGIYQFADAYIFGHLGKPGRGVCTYENASSYITFDIIGDPLLATDNLSADWVEDSVRGMHSWSCAASPAACLLSLFERN